MGGGQLHESVSDAAGSPGQQHLPRGQRARSPRQAQRGQPSERKRRRRPEGDRIGQQSNAVSPGGHLLGPATLFGMRHDALTDAEAGHRGTNRDHRPDHILAGPLTDRWTLEQERLTAVDREGLHRDHKLIAVGCRDRHHGAPNPRLTRGIGKPCAH